VKVFDLIDYYKSNFTLINQFNWTLSDLENMMYWEREIYIQLLNGYIEEKKQELMNEQASTGVY
jgi:hypothetical protein